MIALADITPMKARSEAMAEVVRAKDEFIANISHELRTPLTAVIGLTSEIAATPGMGSEERDDLLDLVAAQAAEMSAIVDDLLVAARAEMGSVAVELQTVDLIEEVRATIDGLGMVVELPKEPTPGGAGGSSSGAADLAQPADQCPTLRGAEPADIDRCPPRPGVAGGTGQRWRHPR